MFSFASIICLKEVRVYKQGGENYTTTVVNALLAKWSLEFSHYKCLTLGYQVPH